jgi:hypothetical protein
MCSATTLSQDLMLMKRTVASVALLGEVLRASHYDAAPIRGTLFVVLGKYGPFLRGGLGRLGS